MVCRGNWEEPLVVLISKAILRSFDASNAHIDVEKALRCVPAQMPKVTTNG